jgi:hypothetical protein
MNMKQPQYETVEAYLARGGEITIITEVTIPEMRNGYINRGGFTPRLRRRRNVLLAIEAFHQITESWKAGKLESEKY